MARSAFFDLWSRSYDQRQLQRFTYQPIHDRMVAELHHGPTEQILDLGCGTGQLTARLKSEFPDAHVIGLDYSAGMLGQAAQKLDGLSKLIRGDAQTLPLPDDRFDAVCCSESFHWYSDQDAAASEVARILRPGGVLLLASIATLTSYASSALANMSRLGGQPIRALPPARLARLLARTGLTVTDQRRISRPLPVPWPVFTVATAD